MAAKEQKIAKKETVTDSDRDRSFLNRRENRVNEEGKQKGVAREGTRMDSNRSRCGKRPGGDD